MTTASYSAYHHRVRYDLEGLNTQALGWISAEDAENFYVDIGTPFRVRWRIAETNDKGGANTVKVRVKMNSGTFVDVGLGKNNTTTPIISVPSNYFTDGAVINTQMLTSGGGSFVNGQGDAYQNSAAITIDATETEVEFCLVINRSFAGPDVVTQDDVFELQIVLGNGTVFDGTDNTVTIKANDTTNNFIGGCFSETWGKMTCTDANGNIYMLIENCEEEGYLLMMKSTDGGASWAVQDMAGIPTNVDLEGGCIFLSGNIIHIAQQDTSHDLFYHQFYVSTHPTNPDEWGVIDQSVYSGALLNSNPQCTVIIPYADGSVWMAYIRGNGSIDSLYYKIRSSGGTWGSEQTIDAEASLFCKGVVAVMGASEKIHIFYVMSNGSSTAPVYHRSLTSGGSLSARETIDSNAYKNGEENRLAWPVYWDSSGNEKIMIGYGDTDDYLKSSVITNDGSPETVKVISGATVFGNGGGSDKVCAFLANNGEDVYAFWSDRSTKDMFYDVASNDGGWGTDTEFLNNKNVEALCTHVFTHSSGNGGETVVGIFYDNGSDGGTGNIWYDELVLGEGPIYQLVSGGLLFSGTLKKNTTKNISGSLGFSGSPLKYISKTFSGGLDFSGSLLKTIRKFFSGTLSFDGSLSYYKLVSIILSGTLSLLGTLTKKTSKIFLGTLSFDGSLLRYITKFVSGSIDFLGTLVPSKLAGFTQIILEGTLDLSGNLTKKVSKTFSGGLDFSGSILKKVSKTFSGTIDFLGTLVPSKLAAFTQIILEGTLDLSGNLTKKVSKTFSGGLDFSGSILKKISKTFSGGLDFSGSILKKISKTVSGGLDFSGSILKKVSKTVSGGLDFSGSLFKSVWKTFSGTLSAAGTLIPTKVVGALTKIILEGTVNFSGSLNKAVSKIVSGNLDFSGTLRKSIFLTLSGTLDFVGTISKSIFKFVGGDLFFSGEIRKTTRKVISGTLTFTKTIFVKLLGIIMKTPSRRIFLIEEEVRTFEISEEDRKFLIEND